MKQGFDPAATGDPIYFNDPQCNAFVRVDPALYPTHHVRSGQALILRRTFACVNLATRQQVIPRLRRLCRSGVGGLGLPLPDHLPDA